MSRIELFSGGLRDLAQRPQGNVPLLDVLRSVAILLVFSTHFSGDFHASARVLKYPFVYYGWSGVDLFFVLSGFLIGGQLWKEVQKSGRIQVGTFLLRRGLRIWPLYFTFVLFVLGEVIFLGRDGSGLLADATFLSNYFHCQIGGGWSLSTEEQFYIVAPISVALLGRVLKVRHLWVVPAGGLMVPILSRAWIVRYSTLPFRELQQRLYFPFHTHSDGLAVGLFIAWLAILYPAFLKSPLRRFGLALSMAIAAAALYAADRVVFDLTAVSLIFGGAVCYGAGNFAKSFRLLDWHGFYIVSRLSYGLYLNHFGILPHLYNVLGGLRLAGGDATYWLCYLISLAFCLAVAGVTFCLIEHPFLVLRSRWLTKTGERDPAIAREVNIAS